MTAVLPHKKGATCLEIDVIVFSTPLVWVSDPQSSRPGLSWDLSAILPSPKRHLQQPRLE